MESGWGGTNGVTPRARVAKTFPQVELLLLFLAAYLGGVLTILSPCILPILPFTFARAGQPFVRTGLPLLTGMAVTFALLASGAAAGGSWLVHANEFGRMAALAIFGVLGVTLVIPRLAELLTRPFVRLGNRLTESAGAGPGIGSSVLLGVATGLLWAPCAGPILGLILTGAAVEGTSWRTSLLLLSYALGAATSLAVAILAGGRVFAYLKRFLGAERWLRPALGLAILMAAVAAGFGLDRGLLTRLSTAGTARVEQKLLAAVHATPAHTATANANKNEETPSLAGATAWIQSPPLRLAELRGKVVLVDFWTYSCINCLRTIPYVEAWAKKYGPSGLIVVGVHTPEFAFEKQEGNVRRAIADLGISYPVAMDNDYDIWSSFDNEYWPAHYLFDANGNLRYKHFGEGNAAESEEWIQRLLGELHGAQGVPAGLTDVHATGAEAKADGRDVRSPETYTGYGRLKNLVSSGEVVHDGPHDYTAPKMLSLNQWALLGRWIVHEESAVSAARGAAVRFRFHARDLHLVLGPSSNNVAIHFRVTVDGRAPGADHGGDTDSDGRGTITGQRLYQLIRQAGPVGDRNFEIEFAEPGAQVFAFTFG